jgi:hypothetical protein
VFHSGSIEPIIDSDPRVGRLRPGTGQLVQRLPEGQSDRHAPHAQSAVGAARRVPQGLEEQEEILWSDPWEYGMTDQGRHTIKTAAGYSHKRGLTRRKWSADELFVSVLFQGRKRGEDAFDDTGSKRS